MEKDKNIIERFFWNKNLSFYDNISFRPTYIIIFTLALFLFNLGKRDFWAPNEPRYAQVSVEMRDGGDLILPHLNGEKYPDKPPTLFWLINIASLPFGEITEFSARLPSALAGVGCALLLYYLCLMVFSRLSTYASQARRIGFLAAIILSTSIQYTVNARRVSFDVLITFMVTLTLFCFYKGYIRKAGKLKFFLFAYLAMSIATITKGPVGFLLPILTMTVFLCVEKYRNPNYEFRIRDMRVLYGAIIVFSIPLLWVAALHSRGGWEHTIEVVFSQNVGRTVNSWSHKNPFYYFFINFPLHFLPWSIFIPGVITHYIRMLKANKNSAEPSAAEINDQSASASSYYTQARNIKEALLFPSIWFIVIFTFFTCMSGKRSAYLIPLYPAAALLTAWFLNEFITAPGDARFKKLCYIPMRFAYIVLVLIGFGFAGYIYYKYNAHLVSIIPVTIIFMAGQVVSFRFLSRSNPVKALVSSFVVILLTVILGTQVIIPVFNEEKSSKAFCKEIDRYIGSDSKFGSFGYLGDSYLFYTSRDHLPVMYTAEEGRRFLDTDEPVFLLTKGLYVDWLKENVDPKLRMLMEKDVGHRTAVFLTNASYPNKFEKIETGK